MQTGPMKNAALSQSQNQGAMKKGSSYKNKKKSQKDKMPPQSMDKTAVSVASSSASTSASSSSSPPGFENKNSLNENQQRILRHRALFAFRVLVGKAVDIKLVDSSQYSGVLDCIDPDTFSVVLKNAQRTQSPIDEPFDDGSTVIFKRLQIMHMSTDGLLNYNENSFVGAASTGGFRTDAEISSRQGAHLFGRELQMASAWLDPSLDTGDLDDSGRKSSRAGWNQFETNEKLFGVVSTYDENIYTTKLDKSKFSSEQSKAAERIAREIERQVSSNFHLQEERGAATHHDEIDEEARYSSVDRTPISRGSNAYVPPALRTTTQRPVSAVKARPQTPPVTAPAPAPSKPSVAPKVPQVVQPPVSSAFGQGTSFSDAVRGKRTGQSASTPTLASRPTATPSSTGGEAQTAPQKVISPNARDVGANTQAKEAKGSPARTKKKEPVAASDPSKATAASPSTKTIQAPAAPAAASPKKTRVSPTKVASPAKQTDSPAKTVASSTAKQEEEKTKPGAGDAVQSSEAKSTAAPKKGLNPNAKEFKLSASAAEFTPRFATTTQYGHKDTHYRGHGGPYHHGGFTSGATAGGSGGGGFAGHHPNPMYPMQQQQEEWAYENGMVMEDGEVPPYGYMQYGMPIAPNAGMMPTQPMYPVMVPQQGMRVRGDGGYMYHHHHHHHQSPYNPRFYPPNGAMNFPPGGVNQPPLPRDPSPMQDAGAVHGSDTSSPSHEIGMPSSEPAGEPVGSQAAEAAESTAVGATTTTTATTTTAPVQVE